MMTGRVFKHAFSEVSHVVSIRSFLKSVYDKKEKAKGCSSSSVKGDATKALCEIGPQPIDRLKVSTTGTVSHSPAENVNNLASETTFDTSSESFV